MISLLVAASSNNAIGKDGQLLWHLPNDLRFFKNTTWGMPVVMGRKTFESVNKPLPGRFNIVITTNNTWQHNQVWVAANINHALKLAEETNCMETFIIGGGEIYRQTMEIADRIYMTRVHAYLEGDTFFPEINKAQWQLTSDLGFPADEKHQYPYTFEVWDKKSPSLHSQD